MTAQDKLALVTLFASTIMLTC